MDTQPPPYSVFPESSPPPAITFSSDVDSHQYGHHNFSQGGLPPPPPRPTQSSPMPRPVSWNPGSSQNTMNGHPHEDIPYYPPPPNQPFTGHDMRASVSGPLDNPYAPVYPAQSSRGTASEHYMPPSPETNKRPLSYASTSEKATGYFDASYQASSALYEPMEKPVHPAPHAGSNMMPDPASVEHYSFPPTSPEKIPQYQQPFNADTQQAPSQAPVPGLAVRPALPPRPVSSPLVHQQAGPPSPMASPPIGVPLSTTASVGGVEQQMAHLSMADPVVFSGKDDQVKSSYGRRFVSNMTVTRIGRAGWQSTMSTVSLPFHLSPWGDNNPITLPNIRKRDVALAGVAFVGAGMMLPSDLTVVEEGAKWAGKFVVEQVADEAIHHMAREKPLAITGRAGVSSTAVKISHKIIGEHAVLRLEGMRQAADYTCCAKAWFNPYLYASGRAPRIERNKDFEFCSFFGPGLAADAKVAPLLLRCTMQAKQSNLIPYCAWETPTHARAHFSRVAVFFLGISPYRTQAWSQARIPNEARLQFHLLSGVPVMVLPVTASTPICAWSGHTLKQLWDGGFSVDAHVNATLDFLQTIIDVPGLDKQWQDNWRTSVAVTLRQMFDGAMFLRGGHHILAKEVSPDRTGLIIFRY